MTNQKFSLYTNMWSQVCTTNRNNNQFINQILHVNEMVQLKIV